MIVRSGCIRPAAWCASRAPNWMRGSPTRNAGLQSTVWDAADGVMLRESSPALFGPPVAKATDGKLWFVTGEGIQVVDPRHLAFNKLPPPVHIEQIVADHKMYWQNLPGAAASSVRLPARTRDLQIDYTALSLVAPEKVHFKYKLEGQDRDWREVVNDREVQYSNLPPGPYRFRVIACNNSGVWNEQGDSLEFSIAPAYYQTNWFRVLCAVLFLALLWALTSCGCGNWRGSSTCAWKRASASAQASPANSMTRCCKVFKG